MCDDLSDALCHLVRVGQNTDELSACVDALLRTPENSPRFKTVLEDLRKAREEMKQEMGATARTSSSPSFSFAAALQRAVAAP